MSQFGESGFSVRYWCHETEKILDWFPHETSVEISSGLDTKEAQKCLKRQNSQKTERTVLRGLPGEQMVD